jgi:hypothetical protein
MVGEFSWAFPTKQYSESRRRLHALAHVVLWCSYLARPEGLFAPSPEKLAETTCANQRLASKSEASFVYGTYAKRRCAIIVID